MSDIDQKIRNAKAYGYIALDTLPLVFALDNSYDDKIPILWERFEIFKGGAPAVLSVEEAEYRIVAWEAIFDQLAFGLINGSRTYVSDGPPYLPLVHRDDDSREIVPLKGFIDPLKPLKPLVLLEDLEKYLTNIVGIGLPDALFGSRKETAMDESRDVDSIIRDCCDEINVIVAAAKEMSWLENVDGREGVLQNNARKRFEENSEEFKYIKLRHLEDQDLFELTHDKERRVLTHKLLKKILSDRGITSGFTGLYDKFKEICNENKA